jgi:hypothetical protein
VGARERWDALAGDGVICLCRYTGGLTTGCVDSVLPLSSMGAALAGLVRIGRTDLARPCLNFAETHLCTFKH